MIRKWRRAEYPAVAKIGASTVIGALSTVYGANAGIRFADILKSSARIKRFTLRGQVLFGIPLATGVIGYFTGDAVVSGFKDSYQNEQIYKEAMENCKSNFRNADQSTAHIASLTIRTW